MSKIYLPSTGPDAWQSRLAEPAKHWRTGYSAKTLAHCWEKSNGLPPEIASMFRRHGEDVELLLAIPEHKVPLKGSALGASQSDLFALIRAWGSTFAVAIEGKVNEPFGQTLGDWLRNASAGKLERLNYLCETLSLSQPLPNDLHYQLLHRAASAVIEAKRFKTDAAAMIVHSFSPDSMWFDSFARFVSLFGVKETERNELIPVRPDSTPPLYLGWAMGDAKFLTA